MDSDSLNAMSYVEGESIFLEPIFTVVSEIRRLESSLSGVLFIPVLRIK